MVYSLTYTRPPRGTSSSSLNGDEKQRSIDESIKSASSCSMCAGIPEALSFDRIISGGTCPVCLDLLMRTIRSELGVLCVLLAHADRLDVSLPFNFTVFVSLCCADNQGSHAHSATS